MIKTLPMKTALLSGSEKDSSLAGFKLKSTMFCLCFTLVLVSVDQVRWLPTCHWQEGGQLTSMAQFNKAL
jgi:hypothetical protein